MSTIKDVAKLSGVSVGTISRYLNGADIKDDNKVKIDDAINALEFKINHIARTLKTSKTNTIGVIIPNLSDIYATTIVRSIEEELYEHGYNIFVCDSWGKPELEKQKVSILLEKMSDGLILYPSCEDISYLNHIMTKQIPVVTIDLMTKGFICDQVFTDNVNATYFAVEWLIKNNHKKIAILTGSEEYFTARERLKGYERVHEDYGLDLDSSLIKKDILSEKESYDGFVELMKLKEPPTAIIAWNYYATLGAVKATYDLSIKVPEQVSLIGFDDIGLSEIARPSLSSIVQPMKEVGKLAAQLLLKRINGQYDDFPVVRRLKTNFILRDSTRKL